SGEIPLVIGTEDLVFPEEDASELAAILKRMICEPEWRQEVRNYGLDRVNRLYTHQKIAQRLIDLWLNLTTGIKADPTMKIYRNESARGLN
ncbi:hypothetical protein MEN24_20845, partial [Dolichospermum sp. ST_sed10]|nr:hypothetical protein [Dolichospermum sp. ST_sed10]